MVDPKNLKVVWICICPEGDSLEALYINGKLVFWGDHYHNDVIASIEGILLGLSICGWRKQYTKRYLKGERGYDWAANGREFPTKLREMEVVEELSLTELMTFNG